MANSSSGHAFERIQESHRVVLAGAQAIGPTNPHQVIEVSVKLRRKKDLPELTGRPTELMTRQELADNYGASNSDIDQVTSVFKQFGLKQVSADAATRTIKFSGTVADMEKAFQVKLFDYSHPEGGYRGRVGYISIPKELKGIVQGVFGLDNRRIARRRRVNAAEAVRQDAGSTAASSWYTSGQLATHYSFPPGDGSGQAVGILEFGGGYFPDDLATYCKMANVPVPTVKTVSTDGTSTSTKDGAEGEVMLDVEVVAGVCPKSTIVVYFAAWSENGWITALDAAVQDSSNNLSVVSASWGAPEDTDIWTTQAMNQFNETLKEAAQLGITVCIAAGDDGSSDADLKGGHAHVDFPGSSPYVLSVGGTTIPQKGGSGPDIVWFEKDGLRSSGGGSTGGGVSAVFARPTWQSGININSVNPGSISGRVMPDISANADWTASPYLLAVDNGVEPNGGTSAATPLLAALVALINAKLPTGKRVGYLTPLLYQPDKSGKTPVGASCCTDVVSGNNSTAKIGGYSAGPGYDAASGWGTPNGAKLLAALT